MRVEASQNVVLPSISPRTRTRTSALNYDLQLVLLCELKHRNHISLMQITTTTVSTINTGLIVRTVDEAAIEKDQDYVDLVKDIQDFEVRRRHDLCHDQYHARRNVTFVRNLAVSLLDITMKNVVRRTKDSVTIVKERLINDR